MNWKILKENSNYLINFNGEIYSLITKKILTHWKHSNGYLKITLQNKKYFIHRLVASNFLGNIKDLQVDHIDLNKKNNHIQNLRICTAQQNINFYWKEQKWLKL